MKKVSFYINGRQFEVELDSDFASYVSNRLSKNGIDPNRNTETPKLLNAYLNALKENYENDKKIDDLLGDLLSKAV